MYESKTFFFLFLNQKKVHKYLISFFEHIAFPMGTLPVLEIDNVRVYQSVAITRYVAKLVGLAGSNDWENLLIDIAVDNISEFRASMFTNQNCSLFIFFYFL